MHFNEVSFVSRSFDRKLVVFFRLWGNLVNPLLPNISMYILHTVLYLFPKVLTILFSILFSTYFPRYWRGELFFNAFNLVIIFFILIILILNVWFKEKLDASHF